jgi:hypothetical protein
VHSFSDVRQRKIHTAKPSVRNPSPLVNEVATTKMKKYKSAVNHQIPEELIQDGSEMLQSKIHELINSIWNKNNFLISGKSLLLYQFKRNTIRLARVIIVGYHRCQLYKRFVQYPSLKVKPIYRRSYLDHH